MRWSKLISLKSMAAVLVSAIGAWIGIEQVFAQPRWPWVGLVLATLVAAIPLQGMFARIVEVDAGSDDRLLDLRDVVTIWIVAAILLAGWFVINLKP